MTSTLFFIGVHAAASPKYFLDGKVVFLTERGLVNFNVFTTKSVWSLTVSGVLSALKNNFVVVVIRDVSPSFFSASQATMVSSPM